MTTSDFATEHHLRRTADGISHSLFEPQSPGTGTVLLLHGWPGTSADWTAVASKLMHLGARIVVPDLRGFGLSAVPDAPPEPPSPQDHVHDLSALLDEVGADRTVVGGYDLGATLAQQLAANDDRVKALVLGAPPYAGIGDRRYEPEVQQQLWYQHFHQLPWASDLVAYDDHTTSTYLRHFYTHWWGDGAIDAGHFDRLVQSYARPGAFEQSIGWYRARQRQRVAAPASTHPNSVCGLPTVVLWGEADPVNPARFADRLPEFFSDLRVTLLPGKGHFLPLEGPDAFAQALEHVATRVRSS